MFEVARRWVPVEEYLAREATAEVKSEYFDGEVFAMAGGRAVHNLISGNVVRELGNQLEDRPCRVYGSDQRVKIPDTGLYTYPDVTVVCEEEEFDDESETTLLNPVLLVEVLSEGTETYDRGAKFEHYMRLPSLREYVLVASDRRRIERFTRAPEGGEWRFAECADPQGSLSLESIGCTLALPRVYLKVEIPAPEPGRRRGPSARQPRDRRTSP